MEITSDRKKKVQNHFEDGHKKKNISNPLHHQFFFVVLYEYDDRIFSTRSA